MTVVLVSFCKICNDVRFRLGLMVAAFGTTRIFCPFVFIIGTANGCAIAAEFFGQPARSNVQNATAPKYPRYSNCSCTTCLFGKALALVWFGWARGSLYANVSFLKIGVLEVDLCFVKG